MEVFNNDATLVSSLLCGHSRLRPMASMAFYRPHSANRDDAGSRGAGGGRVAAVTTNGLAVRLCFSVAEQTDRTYAEQQESRRLWH